MEISAQMDLGIKLENVTLDMLGHREERCIST